MKYYNSDFDYVNEFIENRNDKMKSLKTTCIIISIILIAAGALCVIFPLQVFKVIQYIVGISLILNGVYSIIEYIETTEYFRDPILIIMGILNILMGVLLFFMPVALTETAITFMFAFLMMFTGTQKISFAGRLKYFQIMNTGMITLSGILSIILSVIFILLPLLSKLVLNYIIALYLIVSGATLLIEILSIKKLDLR